MHLIPSSEVNACNSVTVPHIDGSVPDGQIVFIAQLLLQDQKNGDISSA